MEPAVTTTLSIAEARQQLTRLPERFAARPDEGAIAVTRRGEPVLAVMPWNLYEALIDTLEIMGDPELWSQLQESVRELAGGKTISLDALDAELNR